MPVRLTEDAQRIYDGLPEYEQEYLNWLASVIGDEVSEWIINHEDVLPLRA